MPRLPRLRGAAAIALALAASVLVSGPVSAATTIVNCNGNCGDYMVTDSAADKGATCKYENGSYDLDFIAVRPPSMEGPYNYNTRVEWQFKVLRSTNFGSSYTLFYSSGWQGAMAMNGSPAYAGHGFSRRTWNAPENPTGYFKVRVLMRWRSGGASSSIIGNAKVEYDHYTGKWYGNSDYRMDHCIQDW